MSGERERQAVIGPSKERDEKVSRLSLEAVEIGTAMDKERNLVARKINLRAHMTSTMLTYILRALRENPSDEL